MGLGIMKTIIPIAKQQLTVLLRSRWLISFGLLFTVLATMIVLFDHGDHSGFEGFNRMTASLLNVNLMIIPLLSLLIGALFLAGEKEDRRLTLLLTYPISPNVILIGKYVGLFIALFSIITFGYGIASLSIYLLNSSASITTLLLFYLFSILLAAMFLSISMLIGFYAKTRFQALGISLIVWVFTVLLYEFVLMGISLIINKQWILMLFSISIFLNPMEIIRVWAILAMDGAAVFGPRLYDLTVWANGTTGQALFIFSTLVWLMIPLLISGFALKRGGTNE